MEVKSIFVNSIMKAYEKPSPNSHRTDNDSNAIVDKVSVSPEAGKRLFGEMMEQTLVKSLSGKPDGCK